MKNAPIQMFETIAVLIVFFFLLVIGATFYFNMQKSVLGKELQKHSQLQSLQAMQKALFLPELDCSFASVQKDNCFDILKIMKFSEFLKDKAVLADYFETFGFSRITITQIYPKESLILVLYSNLPADYKSKLVTQSPVLLYNATAQSYYFGVIEVETYA